MSLLDDMTKEMTNITGDVFIHSLLTYPNYPLLTPSSDTSTLNPEQNSAPETTVPDWLVAVRSFVTFQHLMWSGHHCNAMQNQINTLHEDFPELFDTSSDPKAPQLLQCWVLLKVIYPEEESHRRSPQEMQSKFPFFQNIPKTFELPLPPFHLTIPNKEGSLETYEIVGVLGVRTIPEEVKSVEIGFFFIDPSQQRVGYGKELLQQSMEFIANIITTEELEESYRYERVALLTLKGFGEKAIKLYTSFGFVLYDEFDTIEFHPMLFECCNTELIARFRKKLKN